MNLKTPLIPFLLFFIVFNCKKESTLSDFKYTNKPVIFSCESVNTKLLNEALYSFEDDIMNYYKKGNENYRLEQAYSQIIRNAVYGRLKIEEVISKHTIDIFNVLKHEDLWNIKTKNSHLNYNSTAVNCMASNITDKALKTTFNALVSTNSMSSKLFGAPLVSKYRNTLKDKDLALYVALDLYYAKIFDVDLSKMNSEKPKK